MLPGTTLKYSANTTISGLGSGKVVVKNETTLPCAG